MKWVTLYGNFRAEGEAITFIGHEMPAMPTPPPGSEAAASHPLYGAAICDHNFSDGRLSADVTFANVDSQTSCELIVAWDSSSSSELSAGIVGQIWWMFEIRSWTPGTQ